MRDDFDAVVADRFKVLDDVSVPDMWSRVLERVAVRDTRSRGLSSDEAVTMIDLETPVPTEPRRHRSHRVGVAVLLAAAAVVAIVLASTRDDAENPADQPAPTVTAPPTTPPLIAWPDHWRTRALFATAGERFEPGTYFVDEVDGTATPRIFVTIGAGWEYTETFQPPGEPNAQILTKTGRRSSTPANDVGFIGFSRPDQVYVDACSHSDDGFHPGPVTTLDGVVVALTEQGGWADVTAPSDISVDGHPGKMLQRTTPAAFSDCTTQERDGGMRLPELDDGGRFHSWLNEDESNLGGWYYEPGQLETLLVLDIDGTVVVINANVWAGSSAADRAEFAAVLASIRIDRE